MKKILMLLLGTMLVLSMAGVVSAESDPVTFTDADFPAGTDSKTAQVTVTLTLLESYEVTIPANVALEEHSNNGIPMYSGSNWLNATVHLMKPGTGLVVNITGTYADGDNLQKLWNLTSGSGDVAQYIIGYTTSPSDHIEIGSNTQISAGSQVIGIADAGKKAELCMHYKLVTPLSQLTTETYTDTLTFGVYVVPKSAVAPMDSNFLKAI